MLQHLNEQILHWSAVLEQNDKSFISIATGLDTATEDFIYVLGGEEEFILAEYFKCDMNDIQSWSDGSLTVQGCSGDYYVLPEDQPLAERLMFGYSQIGICQGYAIYSNYV